MAQLAFDEVQSQSTGIAFCTASQMQPFISNPQSISVDALALLSTAVLPADATAGLPATNVRFPATYAPTGEPVLLSGTLLQLGDENVELARQDIADLEQLSTAIIRVSVYKDETSIPWEDLCKAPVRTLLHQVPAFTLRRDGACKGDCPRFHCAVDEQADPLVLDVWARQWTKLEGGQAPASDALVFHTLMRVPASAIKHFQAPPAGGIYVEPRSTDGHSTNTSFAVIWLPTADRAGAQHAQKTCEKVLAITRLGKKYGLRVKECDEEAVFMQFRPGQSYVKARVALKWRIHPLPFGFQRHHLTTLLRKWNWPAKPLQPLKGDSEGLAWQVGSEVEPPSSAMPVGDKYALITSLKGPPTTAASHGVCATRRTKRHIIYDDEPTGNGDVDPWSFGNDSWSQSASSQASRPPPGLPPPPKPVSAATAKLDQLKEEIQSGAWGD